MARTSKSTRSTRSSLGNPRAGFNSKADKMLRQAAAQEKPVIRTTVSKLNRDDVGRFLVSALAAELSPELEITVPDFPLSGYQILQNMGGFFTAADPVWKGREMQYKIPHQGIVFGGVVSAKNASLGEANQIAQSGWVNGIGNAFAVARAKVRAGQIIVDYLHFLEGKKKDTFDLGSTYIADDLVTELCLLQAEEQGVVLRGISVRPSAQFGYEEIMEGLGGIVNVSAFGGGLEYAYRLPDPMSVIGAIRNLVLATQGEGVLDWAKERFGQVSAAEKRLFVHISGDVLSELYELTEVSRHAEVEKIVGGNGHPVVAEPVAEAEAAGEIT